MGQVSAYGGGSVEGLDAAARPEIGAAATGGGDADDGVCGFEDCGRFEIFDADVAGGVEDCSAHVVFLFGGWVSAVGIGRR